jgi:hypothetical protein
MWFFMTILWLYSPGEWVMQVNINPIAGLLWEKNLQPIILLGFSHGLGRKLPLRRGLPVSALEKIPGYGGKPLNLGFGETV